MADAGTEARHFADSVQVKATDSLESVDCLA